MGYKEVAGRKRYIKFKELEEGEVIVEGTYLKEFEGKYGTQYEFEEADTGDIVVMNATGQLRYKMDFIEEGDELKIVYDGKITLESGAMKGKPCHTFKIYRNDDQDVDVTSQDEDDLNEFVEDDLGGL